MQRAVRSISAPPGSIAWFDQHPEVRFPLRLALTGSLAALTWAALTPAWPALERATALLVASVGRALGLVAESPNANVVAFGGNGFQFQISDGCTGLSLMLIYGAAVLAFPATARQRRRGLTIGLSALFCLNVVRLVALGWVGAYDRTRFETLHHIWFQSLSIAAVGAMWFAWVGTLNRDARGPAPSGIARRLPVARRFVGVLAALILAGIHGHLIGAYATLVQALEMSFVRGYWQVAADAQFSPATRLSYAAMPYATLSAAVALFLAGPGISWLRKLVYLVAVVVPSVLAVTVIGLVAIDGLHISRSIGGAFAGPVAFRSAISVVNSIMIMVPIVIALVLWVALHVAPRTVRRNQARKSSLR